MDGKVLDKIVDQLKDDIIRDTQEIISFRSLEAAPAGPAAPFGANVAAALDYALEVGEKLGMKTKNLEGYAGFAEYGAGEEMVGVLVHVDIVPEGDGWKYPPYGGEIHDGKLYGRGAVDNKGPAIASLYAVKAIMEAGLPVSRRVRVIVGANEESGMKCIAYYKEHEEIPVCGFAPDADYPIINTEKGIMRFALRQDLAGGTPGDVAIRHLSGGTAPNSVPDYCECDLAVSGLAVDVREKLAAFARQNSFKMECEEIESGLCRVKSVGVAAHGSTPEQGQNAIMQMMLFLNTLPLGVGGAADFVRTYNDKIGREYYGESLGVDWSDEISGRLIFNVGMAEMTPDKAEIIVNIRYPISCTGEQVAAAIRENLAGTGLRLEDMSDSAPHHVPGDHFLIKALSKVYEEMTGDKTRLIAIGGGTYARKMPNSVAFGPGFPGRPDVAHKENEYIPVDDLILNTKIYARAIYELIK
ncbi:MAG: dipeptidase PepV [bacterium]